MARPSASLPGKQALLSALVLLLCAAVLFMLLRFPRMRTAGRAGLWLMLAGGLSNLYDRLRYGYVIDFLEFGFVRFPVFNVADVCVVVGLRFGVHRRIARGGRESPMADILLLARGAWRRRRAPGRLHNGAHGTDALARGRPH